MNNYKRILSLVLALILTLSPFTTAFAQTKTKVERTRTEAQEVQIGDKVYYIFSKDRKAKSDLIKSHEKSEEKTEETQLSDGLDLSDTLFDDPVKASQEAIPYTLNIKGSNFKGVGGKSFDWNTLPDGLELQVFYINEDFIDVNVGSPITINKSNYQDVITRTFDIAGEPLAFGMKTNVDTETYLTDVYLTNENSPEPGVGSLDMTFDLVQVPSTKLDVKWVDVNQQPLAKDKTPATILKDILTFNFIENRKFDLPNQDKEDSYFRLVNKIKRKDIKDMEGATALVDGKKNGEEVTLDGKIYKLSTTYDPAYNEGSKIQLMFMPDVIDRTNNPDAETPENYVRVTIDAGEGTKLAQGETKKVYDVRKGKVLKEEHYPKLDILEGYKEPITWTIAPGSVITKAEDIVGKAAKTAAQTITAENLKAVDTTALQGQDLTETFWHKGVALADNVEEAKKAEFEAQLKDATVTDATNPARTTAKAEEQVGTLLVTFKDGSTLEVPNQKLIVKPNTVTVALDKAAGKENPLRDGDTTVKGKITASSNSDKFPVSLDGAVVTIKKGDTVLSRTLANADGSFVAGVKDPLIAGEDISVVVTLPESKTESAPVTEKVQLNPDKLNEIIPTGNKVVGNLEGKKGVDQTKVATLKAAIKKATDDLVETNGKVKAGVTVDATGQKSLDDQYEAIKKAIEALTGNSAPEVTGTSHKEIFKGDALNLEEGITVTDKDGETDIVKDAGKAFTYKVEKIGEKGAKEAVQDPSKINQTAGTYEVTYTAKDKSGAEGTFVMTLVVKEPVVEIKEHFPEVIPEGYVKVEFKPGDHGTLEGTTKFLVKDGSAKTILNAPTIKPNKNYEAKKDANWDPAIPETFTGTEENKKSFVFTAQYTYIGKDVVEQKPGDKKPDVPDNFVKVEFKKGDHGVISSEETTIYWVNPEKEVTLTAPTVTPSHGYKHTGWTPEVQANTRYTEAKEFVAQYKATVVTENPNDAEHYAKVEFLPGDQGTLEGTTTYWVWKGEEVTFNAPAVKANANYKFKAWNPEIQKTYNEGKQHTATYESTQDVSDTEVEGYNKVTFKAGAHGTLTEKSVWVKPDTLVDLTDKAPEVTPAKNYSHIGWKPALIGKFENNTDVVAQYSNNISDTPVEGWTELTFDQGDHGKLAKGAKNVKWVNPKADLKLKDIAPAIVADTNYSLDGWKDGENKVDLETAQKFETAKTFTATYKSNVLTKEEHDKITEDEKKNFVQITFDKGANGKFSKEAVKEVYVKKDVEVDLTEKAPTVIPNQGFGHSGWNPALKGTFSTATTITAQYKAGTFDENAIKEIIVLGPTKMGYGVGEKLDLTGLKVIAKDDAGLQKTYEGVDKIKEAGFTIEPADKTELKMTDNGKHIVVTKVVNGENVKGQTETTLTIHENKSAKAEDVKALNQNIEENGKVTDKPKTTTTVTGKVKPGSTVKITDEQGNDITPNDGVKVENDGTFTAEVTKQEDGKTVKVVVTEEGKQPSDPAEATVARDANNDGKADKDADQKTPTPTAKALNVGEKPEFTTITGKAEKGATVVAKVGDTIVGTATAGDNGEYTIKATKTGAENGGALDKDTEVKVTAQVEGKLVSDPTATVVKVDKDGNGIDDDKEQTERPAAIASNIGKKPEFTTITGEAEKGATVTAKVGKEVVGTATADPETGKYTIQAKQNNAPIKEGVKIDVTATLAPKTESLKQTVVVFNDTDGTGQPDSAKNFDPKKATGMQVVASPDKMVYSDGDQLNLDGLKVLLTDVNGNQKIFTYNNAKNDEFTGAGLSVDYKQGDKLTNADNGKKLTVTLDTKGNTEVTEAVTGETPTALTVNKNQSAQPTDVVAANQRDEKVTKVKGKAVKDAEIKITDAGGNSLLPEGTTIKADANGDFNADLNKLLEPGTKVIVTATEPGKSESPKAETPVIRDKDGNWKADTGSKLSTPVIDPIREKDEKVVVAAPKADDKIQTIEVSDQKGNTVTLTKDDKGNAWTVKGSDSAVKVTEEGGKLEIPVKDKLPLNDRDQIKVTFKDGENPANEAFDKAPVQKASQTPKVDPVYTGDKSVKIADPTVADPTAKTIKVKVGDNDSMTVEKKADGSWKVKEDPNKEVKVEDGKIVVPLDPSAKKGEVIKVSTINDSGKASPAAEVKVVDKEKSTKPEVNPVATNDTKITGKAGPNADVVITITPKDGGTPKEINAKADKEGNFSVPAEGLKDGDTIVAKATEKDKAPAESAPVTVGVDKTKLINAIDDGNNALDTDKGGRNDGTPADKALEKAIEEGEKVKNNPNASQDDVNEKTKAIENAIKEKEETDKALDELKKAKEELDKTIEDAEADEKPNEAIDNGRDASDDADTVINNKGEGKTAAEIKALVEKTKEENRILRLPVIQVAITTAVREGSSIIFRTNPGRCKVTITILRKDKSKQTFDTETAPGGTGSITLKKPLESGDNVLVNATRITEDRPEPDYLNNYTSTRV